MVVNLGCGYFGFRSFWVVVISGFGHGRSRVSHRRGYGIYSRGGCGHGCRNGRDCHGRFGGCTVIEYWGMLWSWTMDIVMLVPVMFLVVLEGTVVLLTGHGRGHGHGGQGRCGIGNGCGGIIKW